MSEHSRNDVCAIIASFHPDAEFTCRLKKLLSQVDRVIIIDNGSGVITRSTLSEVSKSDQVELLINEYNLGIAAAINQGMYRARELQYRWALTLDQDSIPLPGMVRELFEVIEEIPEPNRVAIVASILAEPGLRRQPTYLRSRRGFLYKRTLCRRKWLDNVSFVFTSGALHHLSAIDSIGEYRSDFFVDYVDTEYCLRAITRGYKIAVACNAYVEHKLGDRVERRLGPFRFYPTFHSPIRWYYISRNRILMIRMYALKFPHWLSFEIVSSAYIFLRMLMFENHRIKKLKAMFYGTRDGFCKRMGKIPTEIADKLTVE